MQDKVPFSCHIHSYLCESKLAGRSQTVYNCRTKHQSGKKMPAGEPKMKIILHEPEGVAHGQLHGEEPASLSCFPVLPGPFQGTAKAFGRRAESQNHRIVGVGRDFWRPYSPIHLLKQLRCLWFRLEKAILLRMVLPLCLENKRKINGDLTSCDQVI